MCIAADIVRLQDGILVEHWDVIQDETTQQQSKSSLPMLDDKISGVNQVNCAGHWRRATSTNRL